MRRLTGKALIPPKWALGYIQSQERYETQQEILPNSKSAAFQLVQLSLTGSAGPTECGDKNPLIKNAFQARIK